MKRLVIAGAGAYGKKVFKNQIFFDADIYDEILFFDNDESKWGMHIYGVPVIGPEELFCDLKNVDIIIAMRQWRDVLTQFVQKGLYNSVIGIYNDKNDEMFLNNSYSQHGEDLTIEEYFSETVTGIYVDVGAHHPRLYSNTFWAYKRGWTGINIEPNSEQFEFFTKYRKKDINLNIGISHKDSILKYYKYEEPALNCFDKNVYPELMPIQEVNVRVKTLKQVFEENNIEKIDFMTIDVEGGEYEVLISNDWSRWKPTMVCIEQFYDTVDEVIASKEAQFLFEYGYILYMKSKQNSIFVLKSKV